MKKKIVRTVIERYIQMYDVDGIHAARRKIYVDVYMETDGGRVSFYVVEEGGSYEDRQDVTPPLVPESIINEISNRQQAGDSMSPELKVFIDQLVSNYHYLNW